jgi:hypothetical protein
MSCDKILIFRLNGEITDQLSLKKRMEVKLGFLDANDFILGQCAKGGDHDHLLNARAK